MNVVVTGGAGFIGSHLVEKLLKKESIKKIIIIDCFKNSSTKNLKNVLHNKKIFLVRKNNLPLQERMSAFPVPY